MRKITMVTVVYREKKKDIGTLLRKEPVLSVHFIFGIVKKETLVSPSLLQCQKINEKKVSAGQCCL